jgi:hypothetical protein
MADTRASANKHKDITYHTLRHNMATARNRPHERKTQIAYSRLCGVTHTHQTPTNTHTHNITIHVSTYLNPAFFKNDWIQLATTRLDSTGTLPSLYKNDTAKSDQYPTHYQTLHYATKIYYESVEPNVRHPYTNTSTHPPPPPYTNQLQHLIKHPATNTAGHGC